MSSRNNKDLLMTSMLTENKLETHLTIQSVEQTTPVATLSSFRNLHHKGKVRRVIKQKKMDRMVYDKKEGILMFKTKYKPMYRHDVDIKLTEGEGRSYLNFTHDKSCFQTPSWRDETGKRIQADDSSPNFINSMSPSGRTQNLERKISSYFKPKKPSLFGHK